MVNWKDNIKKLGTKAGKGIVEGAKIVASETKKKIEDVERKNRILDRMNFSQIKGLVYEKGLKPESFDIDDCKSTIISDVSLEYLMDYANRKGIKTDDISLKIDEEKSKEYLKPRYDPQARNDVILVPQLRYYKCFYKKGKPLEEYITKDLVHLWIWRTHHGRDPRPGFEIHHKDFNKYNNDINNLDEIPIEKHRELHRQRVSR